MENSENRVSEKEIWEKKVTLWKKWKTVVEEWEKGKNPITNELFYTLRRTGEPLAAIVGKLVQPSGQNTARQSGTPALTPELRPVRLH
jgi:hypothetical protein